jgi:hypothetical protein
MTAEAAKGSRGGLVSPFEPDRAAVDAFRAALARALNSRQSLIAPILVGRTPAVLRRLGVPDWPMTVSRDVVRKATNGVKHDVPLAVLRQLPEALADPVMVFDSATEPGSWVVLTEFSDASDRPVMAAIHVNQTEGRATVNRIGSVYGRQGFEYVRWIEKGLLRYRPVQKSLEWVRHRGLQLPKGGSPAQGSVNRVVTDADIVNNPDIRASRRDIGERVAEENKDWSEPLDVFDRNAAPTFAGRLRDLTVTDLKSLPADVLKGLRAKGLYWLGRRQLVDLYAEDVPALREYDRLITAYGADSKAVMQRADRLAQDWGGLGREVADRLADVMHVSTLDGVDASELYAPRWTEESAGADFDAELAFVLKERRRMEVLIKSTPGGAKREYWEQLKGLREKEKRLSKPWARRAAIRKRLKEETEREAAHKRVRAVFSNLPAAAQTIYREARDLYRAHWQAVEEVLIARIERSDAVEAEKRRIIDQLRMRFRQELPAIYFPLHRAGDYVLVVKNADGSTEAVMFAESLRAAQRLRRILKDHYAGTDKEVMPIGKKRERTTQEVHPHARGEHVGQGQYLQTMVGSSPRSWGTRSLRFPG